MRKSKGFVATSVIYSFFLVFIAVMAALMSSYANNHIILDRFNEEIKDDLNHKTYFIEVSAVGANIEGGVETSFDVSNREVYHSFIWGKYIEDDHPYVVNMKSFDVYEKIDFTYNCVDQDNQTYIAESNYYNEEYLEDDESHPGEQIKKYKHTVTMSFEKLNSDIKCDVLVKRVIE